MTLVARPQKASLPSAPEPWEDFLDMSRWRTPPSRRVLSRRLSENLVRYGGNYLWIWLLVVAIHGLCANRRLLASFLVIAVGWRTVEMCYDHVRLVGAAPKGLGKEASPPPLPKVWIVPFALLILYEFAVLVATGGTLLVALLIAGIHSAVRPMVNEHYFVNSAANQAQTRRQTYPQYNAGCFQEPAREEEVTFTTHVDAASDVLQDPSARTRRRCVARE